MPMSKRLIPILFVTVLLPFNAMARPNLLFFGVGNQSNLNASNLSDPIFSAGSFGFGGGAGVAFSLSKVLGIEIDAMYLNRQVKQNFSSVGNIDLNSYYLNIPVQLSFRLSKVLFLKAGGYVARGLGTVSLKDSSGAVSEVTYSDAQLIKNDLGVVFSLAFDFPLKSWLGFIAQARYQRGLRNVGFEIPADAAVRFSDFTGIAGFRISLKSTQNNY